jgi:hypothetical protein
LVLGGGVVPGSALSPGTVRVLVTHEQRTCETCPAPTSVPSSVASIAFPHPVGTAPLFAAVAAGGSGFVFVGTELADPGAGDASVGAIVATSPDGLTWTFNEPTAPVFADGAMRGVAAGPSGYVAVGQVQLVPAVWTSADGRSWTQLPGAITPATASLRSVASGPGGFVAVGDDSGAATSWTSADGQAWHAAPRSPELDGARMARVAWTGSSYLAIGESGGNGAAWASADGLAWARLDTGPVLAQAQMWAAASIQSRDVLFATDPTNRIVVAVGTEPANP